RTSLVSSVLQVLPNRAAQVVRRKADLKPAPVIADSPRIPTPSVSVPVPTETATVEAKGDLLDALRQVRDRKRNDVQ
ncbi:MAG TPA: hypothetical protein VGL71_00760, partial [Urbifossiella sp.]